MTTAVRERSFTVFGAERVRRRGVVGDVFFLRLVIFRERDNTEIGVHRARVFAFPMTSMRRSDLPFAKPFTQLYPSFP